MSPDPRKTQLRKTLAGLSTAFVLSVSATAVHAAPVTWLFTGTVDSVAPGSGGGFPPSPGDPTLSDMFSIGDPFTLSFLFDDATVGTQDSGPFGSQPARTYLDDTTNSIDIDGNVFTLTAPDVSGNNQRRVFNSGSTEQVESDTDDDTAGGNATSSIAGVDHVFLDWEIKNSIGNILLDVPGPAVVFPETIDLADWAFKAFELVINDFDIGALATVKGSFDTFEIAGTGDGVPAPGALVLIGFGLLGFAGLRRQKV